MFSFDQNRVLVTREHAMHLEFTPTMISTALEVPYPAPPG